MTNSLIGSKELVDELCHLSTLRYEYFPDYIKEEYQAEACRVLHELDVVKLKVSFVTIGGVPTKVVHGRNPAYYSKLYHHYKNFSRKYFERALDNLRSGNKYIHAKYIDVALMYLTKRLLQGEICPYSSKRIEPSMDVYTHLMHEAYYTGILEPCQA